MKRITKEMDKDSRNYNCNTILIFMSIASAIAVMLFINQILNVF